MDAVNDRGLSALQEGERVIEMLAGAGRWGVLATVGLIGWAYDTAAAVLSRAERRGRSISSTVIALRRPEQKASSPLLRDGRAASPAKEAVVPAVESIEQEVERVLEHMGLPKRGRIELLSREIDALTAKIDVRLAAVSKAEPPFPDR